MKQFWKSALVAAVLTCVLLLSGCSEPITEGTVYDKKFTPAHTESYILPQSLYINGHVTIINIPHTAYKEDSWVLYISNTVDGKTKTREVEVSEYTYNAYDIGDWFTCSLTQND